MAEDPEGPGQNSKGPSFTEQVLGHPEEVARLIKAIEEAADHYSANREKHYRSVASVQARTAAGIIRGTLAVVGGALAITAYLTYRGLVSGDAFTFMAGTVVGSLIAFIAERVAPNLYTIEEAED